MSCKIKTWAGLVGLLTNLAWAQDPSIVSMNGGQITFTNISTNMEYRLEWAPQLNKEFQARYDRIEAIAPTGTAAMTVEVPQFYRIAGMPALSNNVIRASDLQSVIHAETNTHYTLQWSMSPNGPWSNRWTTVQELTSTGGVISVPSPNFYRITYQN